MDRLQPCLLTLGRTLLKSDTSEVLLTARECVLIVAVCKQPSRTISRRDLLELMWPDAEPKKARHSLSQLLYELKAKLGDRIIRSSSDTLSVFNIRWDVHDLRAAFERKDYDAVIQAYVGRFIPDADGVIGALDWRDEIDHDVACTVAEALREEAFSAEACRLETIAARAELVLQHHPHLTGAQIALIHSSVRQGNIMRAENLHARFSTDISDNNLPPLKHFFELSRPFAAARNTAFIGRDEEMAHLMEHWRAARDGNAQVVMIAGESGIGKTHLADQFLRRVAISGSKLWVAACCAAAQRLPYSVVRNLFKDNLSSVEVGSRASSEEAFRALDLYGATSPDETRHRLTETLTAAAEASARDSCLVIFVDDAQWADQYTSLLISYWAHRLKDSSVLILLTVRTHEAEPLPEWLSADLARAHRIELRHLSIESATKIVRSFETATGKSFSVATRDGILWLSAGRPFLLLEALAAAAQESENDVSPRVILTPSAEAVLRRRFHNLSSCANQVAEFLSIWGKPLEARVIARAVSVTNTEMADALDLLQVRGIVMAATAKLTFVHDMMRETAYRLVLPSKKALLHAKAAELSLELHEPPGLTAHHYAGAGDSEAAGRHAMAAANQALAAHSYVDYEYYLRLAHSHGDAATRAESASALARHLFTSGRFHEISGLLVDVDIDRSCSGALELGLMLASLSKGGAASDFVLRAAHLIPRLSERDKRMIVPVLGMVLDVALDANAPEFGSKMMDALEAQEVESGDLGLQIAAHRIIWTASKLGLEDSVSKACSLVDHVNAHHSPNTRSLCHYTLGTLRLLNAEVTMAMSQFDIALHEADRCGDERRQQSIHINRGVALMESGDFTAAKVSLEKALASPSLHVRIRAYTNLAIVHFEASRFDLAADAADTVLSMNEAYQADELTRTSMAILALVESRSNSTRYALDKLSDMTMDHRLTRRPFEDTSYFTMAHTEILRSRGQQAEARELVRSEADRCRPINRLASLRLECTYAELLVTIDADRAYRTATQVKENAEALGATHIANYAASIVGRTRY